MDVAIEEQTEVLPREDSDKELKQLMAEALRTKKSFQTADSSARNLLATMKQDPSWSWANNDVMLAGLKAAQVAVDTNVNDFARSLLFQDMATVKKKHGACCLSAEVEGLFGLPRRQNRSPSE